MFKQFHKHGFVMLLFLLVLLLLVPTGMAQDADGSSDHIQVNDDLSLVPAKATRIGRASTLVDGVADTAVTTTTFPQTVEINTRRDAGSQLISGLQTSKISQLTIDATRLIPAHMESLTLGPDPTPDDPFDNLNDGTAVYKTIAVPAGAVRLVAELVEAGDAQLLVGQGAVPDAASVVCAAAYCNIPAPNEGDWWILVQNRSEGTAVTTLSHAVIAQNDSWCSAEMAACLEEFFACLDDNWFGDCWQALIECLIANMDETALAELEACLRNGWNDDCFEELEECFPDWPDLDDAVEEALDSDDDECDDDEDGCECEGEHAYENNHDLDHFEYREHCNWQFTWPAPNLWVEGPESVADQEPFDLRVFWDEPALNAGEIWYAAFEIGSKPAKSGDIGTVFVDLHRFEDDVVKQVSAATAVPGDILTYTISVLPNVTPEDPTYVMTDTIPAGLSYVPGSATATGGTLAVTDNVLTWTGPTSVPGYTYRVDTNLTNPACAAPLASADGVDDGFLDLAVLGIAPDPLIYGDSTWYQASFEGGEFFLFGEPHGNVLNFTDDGFAFLGVFGPGPTPQIHQPIPTATEPNNMLAALWRDMEIVYDGTRGVALATLFSESQNKNVGVIVEYNGVQDRVTPGSTATYDFEIVAYFDVEPDRYEYVFAYNNLSDAVTTGTIGLENSLGTEGVQYGYDDLALTDGLAICFDQIGDGGTAVEITYQAVVENGQGVLTNEVVHTTDNPGSKEAVASADVAVGMNQLYFSASSDGLAGDILFGDEDIIRYDLNTGQWSLYFDGSDVGLKASDVDALHILDDGSILLSLSYRLKIPGFGSVDDSDIVRFIPTSLGDDSAGTFEMYFDGSDYGLHRSSEDVDAIGFTGDGRLLISTTGSFKVPQVYQSSDCKDDLDAASHYYWSPVYCSQLRGADEDLIVFDSESGSWEMYFNGSDVLDHRNDLDGVWLAPLSDTIYLALDTEFNVGPVSGGALDILVCQPGLLGSDTQCIFQDKLFFNGVAAGLSGSRIDGFAIGY